MGRGDTEGLTRVISWRQPSFFDVGEEIFHGVFMGTFCPGRYGMRRPEGLPRRMTVVPEQILGKGLIELGGWGGKHVV